MHGNIKDIKGKRFGNLVVIDLTNLKLPNKRGSVWKCKCDCGNICYKTGGDLRDKRRKTCSCGCMNKGGRQFPNKFVLKSERKEKNFMTVKKLWETLGDIPINVDTECIDEPWLHFSIGTHREEIWHWFEDTFHVSVAELMYGGYDEKWEEE